MQPEAINALPWWAQIVAYLIMAGGLGWFGVRQYRGKPRDADPKGETQLVAAAIFDRLAIERLATSLDRTTAAMDRLDHSLHETQRRGCDCTEELIDELRKHRRTRSSEA